MRWDCSGWNILLELSVSRDRQTQSGHHQGGRSGAHLEPPAHEQGHDPDDEPLGTPESARDRRARRRIKRKVAPSRTERVDHNMVGGGRG